MMSVLFGTAIVLAAFLLLNVLASLVGASLATAALARRARPARRARAMLVLRLLPTIASLGAVALLIVPGYVVFEPPDAGESVTMSLGALAAAAAVVLVAGAARGLRSVRATSVLVRRWRREGEPISLPGSPVPAYRVRDAFPVFAVVGMWRARIYVAAQVLDALGPAELEAALAHERAHLRARDNLKRLVLRSCPDMLAWTGVGRALEREWARAAEAAADAEAAGADPTAAADLAAGIVKIARLLPAGAQALAVSALHDGGDVAARVRALVSAERAGEREDAAASQGGAARACGFGLVLAASLAATQAWPAVHRLIEAAARLLR
jgi:Zn-dependent protease with chaperone function